MQDLLEDRLSADGLLEIQILGWAEPAPGQRHWEFRAELMGSDFTRSLCGDQAFLNPRIQDWRLEDAEQRCWYLPVAGQSRLVVQGAYQVRKLPAEPESRSTFRGNWFCGDYLIESYLNHLQITHLNSFKSQKIALGQPTHLQEVELRDPETLFLKGMAKGLQGSEPWTLEIPLKD